MFVGRKENGDIYGTWTTRPADDTDHPNVTELDDLHPDIIAFEAALRSLFAIRTSPTSPKSSDASQDTQQ